MRFLKIFCIINLKSCKSPEAVKNVFVLPGIFIGYLIISAQNQKAPSKV